LNVSNDEIGGIMFSNRSRIANSLPFALLLVISLVLPLALGSTTGSALAASIDEPPVQGEPITPLQEELAKAINLRHAAGLPVPSVSFGSQFDGNLGSIESPQLQTQSLAVQQSSITATTIIYFDEPQEAGYDEWPAQEISGNLAGNESASFSSGDFTEGYRDAIEKQMPGFWQQVEFGHEAREYSLTETIELTSPSNNPQLAAICSLS
jgi:hypothetical protein